MNLEETTVVDAVMPSNVVIETPAPKAVADKKKKPAAKPIPTPPAAKKASTPKAVPAAAKPVAAPKLPKPAKVNPSASYIGFVIASDLPITVNYRQGKKNIVECNSIICTGANATGRRLDVSFKDVKGKVIMERRVYKEFFEKMAKVASVLLPE